MGKDVGCIGVECKHCAGKVDSRKFFWSSVNAVESNFVSVHTHMMECKMIPEPLKEKIGELKKLRKEQTAALKTGSQKAFFSRVWKRLHSEGPAQKKQEEKEGSEDPEATEKAEEKAQETTSEDSKMDESTSQDGSAMEEDPKTEEAPLSPSTIKLSDEMAIV